MWRTSRMKSPLGHSNEATSSSHAVEAAPVAAPRSNKFMGSPPSHVVGSWKPKHPTVVALQLKQLVWSLLKNKGIKPIRKSFVPSCKAWFSNPLSLDDMKFLRANNRTLLKEVL
ncbi:kinesin-like protein KIN-14S [Tanacetum coccineum]